MTSSRPTGKNSARENAYRHIHSLIVSGALPPGSVLSELQIAKDLDSSRSPVREAIGRLAAEGLVEQFPNRGSVVAQLERTDIVELYELREALEVFTIRKVAGGGLSAAHAEQIRETIEAMRALRNEVVAARKARLDAKRMEQLLRIDLTFHTLLLRLGGNRRFLKLVSDSRLLIRIFGIRHEGHTIEQVEQIERWHTRILEPLLSGDADEATRCLSEHIRLSRDERLDAFDLHELEGITVPLPGAQHE